MTDPTCELFHDLPLEILHLIAQIDEPSYKAILAVPRFARTITPGRILDYMELFGHDAKIFKAVDGKCICWTKNEELHKLDGPAVIYENGDLAWYKNGEQHRLDGPAEIHANGDQFWYRDGKRHRENGPAEIRTKGDQIWYQNNQCHRLDGPAVIWSDGLVEYYEYGIRLKCFKLAN